MSKYFENIDYQLLDKKIAYQGKRLTVEELNYYNPRKKQKVYREHVLAGEAVLIMPVTENDEFIMIKEPRTPIEKTILAFPAGMLEKDEDAELGAIRELEEETGYRANKMKKLREVYPAVGYSNEKITIYLAEDLVQTHTHFDETEDIEIVKIPVKKVIELLENNEIKTAVETVALFHYIIYEMKS